MFFLKNCFLYYNTIREIALQQETEVLDIKQDKRMEYVELAILLTFTFMFRLVTLMIMNTGIDESDYWTAAKSLRFGLPYPPLSHRTVRWSVILPAFFSQLIFGVRANVYYVVPIVFQMLQSLLLYRLGKRIHSRTTGALAAIATTVFPYSARVGSQLRPEVTSSVYILAAFWYLLNYLDSRDSEKIRCYFSRLLPSVAFLYIAYHSKITNLYFLPGFLVVILLLGKSFRHTLYFGLILLGLYVVETGIYAIFTNYDLGQIQIIAEHHFKPSETASAMGGSGVNIGDYPFSGFFALFMRYAQPYLQWYWQIPFALFAVAAFYYSFRKRTIENSSLLIVSASFFLCITFTFRSLKPLVLVEPFINRYFYAVLGFVMILLSRSFVDIVFVVYKNIRKFCSRNVPLVSEKARITLIASICILLIATVPLSLLTSAGQRFGRYFAWDPCDLSTHALARNNQYRRLLNAAVHNGTAVVADGGSAGQNAIRTVLSYYLDKDLVLAGLPTVRAIEYEGRSYWIISGPDRLDADDRVIAVRRGPFEAREVLAAELPAAVEDRLVRFENNSTGE
jgi:hypothetical protein